MKHTKQITPIQLICAVATIIAISCAEKKPEADTALITDSSKPLRVRYEDTVTEGTMRIKNNALKQFSFTELIEFLPQDLEGYELRDPINGEDGSIGKSGSRYYSYATKTFSHHEKSVRIEIVDYSEDSSQFRGMLHMYGFDTTGMEDNVMTTNPVSLQIPGTRAVANKYKQENASRLIIGAADRIMVVITGMQTKDLDLLKRTAKKIDFKKLIAKAEKEA